MAYKDPEQARQHAREYYKKNKDKIAEYRKKNKDKILEHAREYYKKNRDKILKTKTEYSKKNKDKIQGVKRNYILNIKISIIWHYSNGSMSCACCGLDSIPNLTLDHIDGKGIEDRRLFKSTTRLYKFLIKNNFPEGYQILCFACNLAKRQKNIDYRSQQKPISKPIKITIHPKPKISIEQRKRLFLQTNIDRF